MTEVLHSPSSSSTTSISTPTHNATLFQQAESYVDDEGVSEREEEEENRVREKREEDRREQLSLLALLLTLFRKRFWLACKTEIDNLSSVGGNRRSGVMEIGWPTDVQHVNHVTFDRFDGFLGLPVEFEPEVPRRAPSASATVFGVSTESMQLSYDPRGNSIPTILLLLQRHLYHQRGLQAEGIFRLTAGNSQEEYVRDQLNRGVIPEGVDVHCLAGLIKAWFRELPRGVLDSLSHEQVMQCQSEEACDALVRLLPPTEAALLDWAINLMADVVQEERLNKMNAHNIAMVFAPNMTQMDDPLTALMYAVQVMNFLKTLIEKTLRERGESVVEEASACNTEPSDDDGHRVYAQLQQESCGEPNEETAIQVFVMKDPGSKSGDGADQVDNLTDDDACSREARAMNSHHSQEKTTCKTSHSNRSNQTKHESRMEVQGVSKSEDLSKGVSNLSRINSMTQRCEAWR